MSTVNLYDVLNLQHDCNKQQIKDAYRKLVIEFHPDKENGDPEMFELITHAYNILINPDKRSDYDEIYKLSKQTESDHFKLKDKSKNYYDSHDDEATKKRKEKESQAEFDKAFASMDKKHKYKRDVDDKQISSDEAVKMVRDWELARDQEDIENMPEKLFDLGGKLPLDKFNKAFEDMHGTHTELVKHNGNPGAWNSDDIGTASFSTIDNYEELYADENEDVGSSSKYGSVKVGLGLDKKKQLSKGDIEKLKGSEYTSKHNYKDKDYKKSIEDKLRERESETQLLAGRKMDDYDQDPSCGGYGIFDKLNLKNQSSLTWDDDNDDVKTRFNRLLELKNRKNNDRQ